MTNRAKLYLFLLLFSFSASYGQQTKIGSLPKAVIKGHLEMIGITNPEGINLEVVDPIVGKNYRFHLKFDSLGYFELGIPMAFPAAGIVSSIYSSDVIVFLAPGRTTKLEIKIFEDKPDQLDVDDGSNVSVNERRYWFCLPDSILNIKSKVGGIYEILAPDEYRRIGLKNMNYSLLLFDSDKELSDASKIFLKKVFETYFVNDMLMGYESFMSALKNRKGLNDVEIPKPDLSYYSFLKDLNLSDTLTISSLRYSHILNSILDKESIPDDLSPSVWIASMKSKWQRAVGDNQDLFYDMLLANLYGKQIRKGETLSEKQISDIRSYYKDNDIAKILLYENARIDNRESEEYSAEDLVDIPFGIELKEPVINKK